MLLMPSIAPLIRPFVRSFVRLLGCLLACLAMVRCCHISRLFPSRSRSLPRILFPPFCVTVTTTATAASVPVRVSLVRSIERRESETGHRFFPSHYFRGCAFSSAEEARGKQQQRLGRPEGFLISLRVSSLVLGLPGIPLPERPFFCSFSLPLCLSHSIHRLCLLCRRRRCRCGSGMWNVFSVFPLRCPSRSLARTRSPSLSPAGVWPA